MQLCRGIIQQLDHNSSLRYFPNIMVFIVVKATEEIRQFWNIGNEQKHRKDAGAEWQCSFWSALLRSCPACHESCQTKCMLVVCLFFKNIAIWWNYASDLVCTEFGLHASGNIYGFDSIPKIRNTAPLFCFGVEKSTSVFSEVSVLLHWFPIFLLFVVFVYS
jgi:hypothetical protein